MNEETKIAIKELWSQFHGQDGGVWGNIYALKDAMLELDQRMLQIEISLGIMSPQRQKLLDSIHRVEQWRKDHEQDEGKKGG